MNPGFAPDFNNPARPRQPGAYITKLDRKPAEDEDEFSAFVLNLGWEQPGNFALLIPPETGPLKVFTLDGESI